MAILSTMLADNEAMSSLAFGDPESLMFSDPGTGKIEENGNNTYEGIVSHREHPVFNDGASSRSMEAAKGMEEEEVENPYCKLASQLVILSFGVLVVTYLLAAFIIDFQRALFLFIATVLIIVYSVFQYLSKRYPNVVNTIEESVLNFLEKAETDRKYGIGTCGLLLAIIVVIIATTVRDGKNLTGLIGLVVYISLAWLVSYKPRHVKWRPVIAATFMQFIFGVIVMKTKWGQGSMTFLSNQITTLADYTKAGSSFVFGFLTDDSLYGKPFQLANDGGEYYLIPPFFFSLLPTVIFFSALVSMGYYLRILPWFVRKFGYFLSIFLGTSASESVSAAGNIFLGGIESALLVKPFIDEMTESELHAIMTGGFATIAASLFAVYAGFGLDPVAILSASIMSAPAALAMSKLAYPETEDSKTGLGKKGNFDVPKDDAVNVVHAASNGAYLGMQLLLNITANLIAALAILAMLDAWLLYLGAKVDIHLSFTIICEILFYPFAWLMGVDAEDCREVAAVLGLKVFANEFVAYESLAFTYKDQISARSFNIATYALCGFSNFGGVGITLSSMTTLSPKQGPKLAKLVMSAMFIGNIACYMTACIAGIFYED